MDDKTKFLAYSHALEYMIKEQNDEFPFVCGLCTAIYQATYEVRTKLGIEIPTFSSNEFDTEEDENYPELSRFRPEIWSDSQYWFSLYKADNGGTIRINILKEILALDKFKQFQTTLNPE